jgi:hypothetical protein
MDLDRTDAARPEERARLETMRPFGCAADLDLDFGQADRPGLVTALLTQCAQNRDAAFWWAQPVGERTAALLQLVAATEQRDEVPLNSRCADGCGETFEFVLPLCTLPRSDSATVEIRLGEERVLTMRRPTGDDLRRWRAAQPASRAEAFHLMLDSLVLEGHAEPEDEAALSASFETMDPLVDFTVSCRCPGCGAAHDVAVDLESLALASLARRQHALLREVHCLAVHYGWTESDVLAVPPARRARYLALIEEQR